MRRNSFDRFMNVAMVAYVILVPLTLCSGMYSSFFRGMKALGPPQHIDGDQAVFNIDPCIRWLASHPFKDDTISNLGSLLDVLIWTTIPALLAGAVATLLYNKRGNGSPEQAGGFPHPSDPPPDK
jgi:hypothetical protein